MKSCLWRLCVLGTCVRRRLSAAAAAVQAVADFEARIREYEKVYQPLTDGKSNRHVHFIQLVNMVTGRGYMDINRISGYLPGKIVFFLMQARPPARAARTSLCFVPLSHCIHDLEAASDHARPGTASGCRAMRSST